MSAQFRFLFLFSFVFTLACGVDQENPKATPGLDPDKKETGAAEASLENNFAKTETEGDEFCDNLQKKYCLFPFPNNYFTRKEDSSATGIMLNLPMEGMPLSFKNKRFNPELYNTKFDGFSSFHTMLAFFPGLSEDNLPDEEQVGDSVLDTAPIIVLNEKSGEKIPYFAELDAQTDDPNLKSLLIHPMKRMKDAETYIVGIRNLKNKSGELIEAEGAFKALRDKKESSWKGIHKRRGRYEEIFSSLAKAGFKREELQLAWEFTTSSLDAKTGDMTRVRDDMTKRFGSKGPEYIIKKQVRQEDKDIALRIEGEMKVPLYMDKDGIRAKKVFDDKGKMVFGDQMATVPFYIHIPKSVFNGTKKGRLMVYGHGLMGSIGESKTGYLGNQAERYGYIIGAVDWQGMSTVDASVHLLSFYGDLEKFNYLTDRLHQGVNNFVALTKMVLGDFRNDPAVQVNGESMFSDEKPIYYGNSQGGILGTIFAAISEDVDYSVLGVGAIGYSLIIERSKDFEIYQDVFFKGYPEVMDRTFIVAMLQTYWDQGDGSGYLPLFDQNPEKRVLMQIGTADRQVSHLGAYAQAISMNASTPKPTVRSFYGVAETDEPIKGHAIVEFDYGYDPNPKKNINPSGRDSHEDVRRTPEAQEQMDHFYRTGEIKNFCPGACKFTKK